MSAENGEPYAIATACGFMKYELPVTDPESCVAVRVAEEKGCSSDKPE